MEIKSSPEHFWRAFLIILRVELILMSETVRKVKNNLKSLSKYSDIIIERVFENISEGVMLTDANMVILGVNPAFEFVTGYKAEEVVGQKPTILQSGAHDAVFYRNMWNSINEHGIWQGEIWNRRKMGDVYPEWLSIIRIDDEEGNIINFCGIFTDLSERKDVESELEKRILTDSLTNVSNRFAFNERMNSLLQASASVSRDVMHAIFFLDLDRFKQVNDTLGHTTGDLILVHIARKIQSLLKNKDILARYGGDEFVITLTNIKHPREAAVFAEKLISIIEEPIVINDQEIFMSTSIGVSIYPNDGVSSEELVNKADKAMYFSKQNGRNRFEFYFDELNTDTKRVLLLDSELRKAIEQKDFELHFQPKVCMKTMQISGVEALVRWKNEKLGFVSPAEFIPHAEETGLIIPMSEIIFEKAFEAGKILGDLGYNKLPIAINVSSIHFQQKNFLNSINKLLIQTNTSATNFEIEMTERTVMNSAAETISKLVKLKQLGFKLSIDDFGTGYSSLSYLVRFPLDVLKIDRSFIQQICILDDKQAIVDAIIQMSHRLNMKVVAEGVESAQQVELLKKMKCDYIQGFYYSKPLPIDELAEFLEFWEVEHQGRL